MSSDTERLHVDVATNAPEAAGGVNVLNEAWARAQTFVAKMEAELSKLTGTTSTSTKATIEHGQAHVATTAHVAEDAGALEGLAAAMRQVEGHSIVVARGLEVLGLEAQAGAVKVGALAEVLEGLSAAVVPLLAIGAVIGAASLAFGTLRESVDAAAKSQRELVIVGAMLRDTGVHDWGEQAKAVEEYAAHLASTTVFQKTEFLEGMKAMLTAGVSYNDMMRSQQAAQDLAVSRDISLVDAERMLAMAYDGRLIGLKRLGLVTAEEVKNGLPYEELLTRIEHRMGGTAAAALDTYSGKMKNFGNLVEELHDTIGTALLPVLSAMADQLRAGAHAVEPLAQEFAAWSHTHAQEFKTAIREVGEIVGSIVIPAIRTMIAVTESAISTLLGLGSWFNANRSSIGDFFTGVKSVMDAFGIALGTIAGLVFPAFKQSATDGVAILGEFGHILTDLKPLLTAVFEVMLASTAISAFNALRLAAAAAIATMVETEWWALLSMGIGLVSDALIGGLTPALWADVSAWWALAGAEAAATLGLTAAVGAMVTGAVYLWNNWDETINAAGGLWDTLATTIEHATARINSALAGMYDGLAQQAKHIPLIGDSISAKLSDQAAAIRSDANAQGAYGLGPAPEQRHKIQDALTGQWLWSDTMEPVGERGGQIDNQGGGSASWGGAPSTTPSKRVMPGTGKPPKEKTGKSGAQALQDVTQLDHYKAKTDELKTALAALNIVLHENDDAEAKAKAAIALTTTAEDEKAAKAAYSAVLLKDLRLKLDAYNNEMVREDATTQFVMDRKVAEIATHDRLVDVYDKLMRKKEANGGLSDAEALQAANLKGQIDASGKKIDEYTRQIDANTAAYNNNATAARRVQTEIDGVKDAAAIADAAKARADEKAAAAATEAWRKWSEAEQQRMAESLATFGMTSARKVVFYQDMLDRLLASDVDYDAKRKDITKRRDDAEIAANQDRIKTHDAMVKTIEDREKSYLDGIILQHKSLRDTLKSIFTDILTDFVHMIEQMIVKSALLKTVNGSIMAMFGLGGGGGGLAPNGAPAGSVLAGVPGLGFGPGSSSGNPLYTAVQAAGAPYLYQTTGSSTGVPGLSGGMSALTGGSIGSLLMLAAGALGIGSFVGGAVGGPGAPNASMNGALGGLLGAGGMFAAMGGSSGLAFLGPVGLALLAGGALLGGIGGGMIGPHWGDPSKYPDRSDPTYRGWLDSFNSGPGGVGDKIERLVAGTDGKQLTGQALADYQKLKALEGGTGQLGIANEHDGVFTLISGMKIAVADFRATVDRFGTEMAALGQLAPTFTLTRTYPDFNIANVSGAGSSAGSSGGSSTGDGSGGSGGGGGNTHRNTGGPDITIDMSGATIVGPAGLDQVANTISQAIKRAANGETAGGRGLNGSYSA